MMVHGSKLALSMAVWLHRHKHIALLLREKNSNAENLLAKDE